jgi:hypothetical protein
MCSQAAADPWAIAFKNSSRLTGSSISANCLRQVQVIPADDAILDEPFAGLGHLLVLLFRLQEFTRVADRDRADLHNRLVLITSLFNRDHVCGKRGHFRRHFIPPAGREQGLLFRSQNCIPCRLCDAKFHHGLRLIDHVIVGSPALGKNSYFNFKETGVIS